MTNNKLIFLLTVVLFGLLGYMPVRGQENWRLKSDRDGISVFMRSLPDSKFKAVKVEVELDATLSQLVAVVLDVNTGGEWVYSTKSSVLLKQVSPSELYYYSEVNIPWPISNRDFIAHLIAVQDPKSKVVTIYGPTVPDYVPVKNDIVRITHSEGKWVITSTGPHKIRVEYTLQVDPGGTIPAWLINLFAAKGPYESFKGLRTQLQKPAYANVHLPFIVD